MTQNRLPFHCILPRKEQRDTILVYFLYLLKYYLDIGNEGVFMTEIIIYTAKDGHVELDVNIAADTVWLSMAQIVQLFHRDKSVISRHLNNVFKINGLTRNSVVANFATTAADGKVTRSNIIILMLLFPLAIG